MLYFIILILILILLKERWCIIIKKSNKYILASISAIYISNIVLSTINNNEVILAVDYDNSSLNSSILNRTIGIDEDFEEEIVENVELSELLSTINSSIALYKESENLDYLTEAIETFGSIPKYANNITNTEVKNSVELNDCFNELRVTCYNLPSKKNQESYVTMLSEKIFLGWKYDKDIMHYKDVFLLNGLVDYNTNKLSNIQERLDYLKYVTEYYSLYGDQYPKFEVIPDIMMPEERPPVVDEGLGGDNGNNDNSNNNNNNNSGNNDNGNNNQPSVEIPVIDNSNNFTYITKFEKDGNSCYKVEETYQDGEKIKEDKSLANKSDYVQCSIYDYLDLGTDNSSPNIQLDEDYLYNNQNTESEYFAYYTITKNTKNPYYFNTGIRASSDGKSLSYNQLRDLLYQITIKLNSFNVKSNNKSLFVVDGQPIVLDKLKNFDYNTNYIESIFDDFNNVDIKIMKDSNYKQLLVDYNKEIFNKKYINNIIIDGKLSNKKELAWLDAQGVIKVDIQSITELLGATTSIEDDMLYIKKDKIEIVIQNDNLEYMVNDETTGFLNKVYKDNGRFICELANIPQKLGFDVDFAVETFTLDFSELE